MIIFKGVLDINYVLIFFAKLIQSPYQKNIYFHLWLSLAQLSTYLEMVNLSEEVAVLQLMEDIRKHFFGLHLHIRIVLNLGMQLLQQTTRWSNADNI